MANARPDRDRDEREIAAPGEIPATVGHRWGSEHPLSHL